jgi:hypothetical protein
VTVNYEQRRFVHPIAPTRFRAPEELFAGVCLFLNPNFLTPESIFCKKEEAGCSFFQCEPDNGAIAR